MGRMIDDSNRILCSWSLLGVFEEHMKGPFDLRKFLIPILRRKSLHSPERTRCLNLARIERGFYRCNSCKNGFSRKNVHVDHIDAVVSVKDGWVDWNTYIERLFIPAEEMQVLCVACHTVKCQLEASLRSINKKKSKKNKK
jgi:hypothetical protein